MATSSSTYTLDYDTATASDLAWWVDYAKRGKAAAAHNLARGEITQEQFDVVVATCAKQAEEFAEAGYVA